MQLLLLLQYIIGPYVALLEAEMTFGGCPLVHVSAALADPGIEGRAKAERVATVAIA
ncbi:MAG: hypothetical protein HY050_00660 [Actinobacteria bacterium]|nr:hypothetical protein [Actinomycetota bacterium]